MSVVKNFDPALYESHFEAIRHFIQEGHLAQYDFEVTTMEAVENALGYLCVNDIQHGYHVVGSHNLYLVTITWEFDNQEHTYCCWCNKSPQEEEANEFYSL